MMTNLKSPNILRVTLMTIFEHHIHHLPAKPMDWMVEDYAEELGILENNMADFFDFNKFYMSDRNLWTLIVQSDLLKKPAAECIRHWYDYQQVLMKKVLPFIHKDNTYKLRFRHKNITMQPAPLGYLSVGDWLDVFHTTLLLRDPYNQLDDLLSIDQDDFNVTVVNDDKTDFFLVLYRLYQGIFGKENKDLSTLVGDIIEFSAPEFVGEDTIQETVNYIDLPLTQMLVYAHTSERDIKYHEKLQAALEAHKQYYTANMHGEDMEYSRRGWLSLGITAIAAYAHDKFGLAPQVKSEYIPEWLIKGDFLTPQSTYLDLLTDFKFEAKNLMVNLSKAERDDIFTAMHNWIHEDPDLPPLCSLFTAESNKQVTKLIAGEVYVDTLGEEQTLTVYSMEPSLIPDPEEWLAKMTALWEVLNRQFSSDATISAELFDYEG